MEDSLVEKGKDICETIDQLIDEDKKFIINKSKLYCKYCLSLGKDEVNSIANNFYEECEVYLKESENYLNNRLEMNQIEMKQIENDFINSYETNLAKEGEKLCKEIENNIKVCGELLVNKATTYCQFIVSKLVSFNPKLVERCKSYLDDVNNFYRYECTFKQVNNDRREKKSWLDMRHMRLNGI